MTRRTLTAQQIEHIATLHRVHQARHKRYRESPLSAAVAELIAINHAEQTRPRPTIRQRISSSTAAIRWALACWLDQKKGRQQ